MKKELLQIHLGCDDYSQAYFPHMDKKNGILTALNIEAKKNRYGQAK